MHNKNHRYVVEVGDSRKLGNNPIWGSLLAPSQILESGGSKKDGYWIHFGFHRVADAKRFARDAQVRFPGSDARIFRREVTITEDLKLIS